MVTRRLLVALLAGVTLALVVTISGSTQDRSANAQAAVTKPNIVFILTDDQRWDELAHMPNLSTLIQQQGMTFANAFVVNPYCCPSRTTILTGNYSHTTMVYANAPPNGGFKTFHQRGEESSTVATWLHKAGYETAMFGKYLNGYGTSKGADPTYVPPGWDDWAALLLTSGPGNPEGKGGYCDTSWSVNGTVIPPEPCPAGYTTDVMSSYATDFIRSVPADKPLFAWIAPRAPHSPFTPPQRYGACTDQRNPSVPSFNVVTAGQPAYLQAQAVRSPSNMRAQRNKRCGALRAVDDLIGHVVQTLKQTSRLSHTLIVFASDNGYEIGEHRWDGKVVPYNESIRIPLMMRWGSHIAAGSTNTDLVANVDLAQTFADVAGATAAANEGHSLLPLMLGSTPPDWRQSIIAEHWQQNSRVPAYCAIRSKAYLFDHYNSGEEELYAEPADPYELTNLASKPSYAATVAALKASMYDQGCAVPAGG